jgi:hypothetical protein
VILRVTSILDWVVGSARSWVCGPHTTYKCFVRASVMLNRISAA